MCRLTCANCSMYVWQRSPAYLFLCVLDLPRLPSALLGRRGNGSHCNRKSWDQTTKFRSSFSHIRPRRVTCAWNYHLFNSQMSPRNASKDSSFQIRQKKDPKTIKNMEPHPKRSSLSRQNTGTPYWSDTEDMSSQSWNWRDTPFHSLS